MNTWLIYKVSGCTLARVRTARVGDQLISSPVSPALRSTLCVANTHVITHELTLGPWCSGLLISA